VGNPERMDGGQELTRIPERDARSEGEHVDEQKDYGGSPTPAMGIVLSGSPR